MPEPRKKPKVILCVERLESRDAPSASPWPAETFDTVGIGQLPGGWAQWSSNGTAIFGATAQNAASGPRALASTTTTNWVAARTWFANPQPADVEVSSYLYTDNSVPAHLVARARNLNTAAPTYYGLVVNRMNQGLELRLVRVLNGPFNALDAVQTVEAFDARWVRLTLSVQGSTLRAQVYRPDTNQFLDATGRWGAAPAWTLTAQDTAITGGGQVGFAVPASVPSTILFDEFQVFSAAGDPVGPQVSLTAPTPGATLTGTVAVRAAASDNVAVNRVEFFVDGVRRSVDSQAPYEWAFDSSSASNGGHLLTAQAFDLAGNAASAFLPVLTQNADALPVVAIPRHFDHIRVAEVAYAQGQIGEFEKDLLRRAVDLVVTQGGQLTNQITAVAPNTPQLLYTNLSTLYQNLLTDWLAYADAHGLPRESAFYHVARSTAYTGASPSSQPVNWFWTVYRDGSSPRDMTVNARGTSGGLYTTFGSKAGDSVYLGYPDRFREVNFDVLLRGGSGWAAEIEYVAAVDTAGNPTAWKRVSRLGDDTGVLTSGSGRMWFNPPRDWKPARINGSAPQYFIRYRTTAPGIAPILRSVLGRDYTAARGGNSGWVPAFDHAADLDGDGYLSDAEFANRARGMEAWFEYESRALYGGYGQMRFATNPSNPNFRAWAMTWIDRLLQTQPPAVGVMIDNSLANPPLVGEVREPVANYQADYADLVGTASRTEAPRLVMVNTGSEAVIRQALVYSEENTIRALADGWDLFEAVSARLAQRLALRSPSPYAVIDSLPTNGTPDDPRTQMATLAYYYLLADRDWTFINFFGSSETTTTWRRHWVEAAAYNIGQASAPWSVFATGKDPMDANLDYRVYQRTYTNARVLYKPLSYGHEVGRRGTIGNPSATTHSLGGTYRPLLADGTLGSPLTQITLRNGEGAILVKV